MLLTKDCMGTPYILISKMPVSHIKLLRKLHSYGVCGSMLNWIKSFLSGSVLH